MIKKVDSSSISMLFDTHTHEPKVYTIPKYQREYTWGKKEWETLLTDILVNDSGYFLGSIICVNDNQINPNYYELIDGQQRMTTISILLTVLYTKLYKYRVDLADDEDSYSEFINLKKELVNSYRSDDGKKSATRIQLQVQNSNRDDYESLLRENKILDTPGDKPRFCGLRRIYTAYNFFSDKIDEYVAENSTHSESYLLFEIAQKVNSAVMVTIEVDSHKDAYMLFESLNNRGIPLSSIDLIKNLLISVSEKDHATDSVYAEWKGILKNLGDNYTVQERFFRQYYNAFRDEINAPYVSGDSTKKYALGYLATRTTILEIYERIIKDDYKSFVSSIKEASYFYSIIINNNDDVVRSYQGELKDLERIQGAPSYLLLLYLFKNSDALNIDDSQMKRIIALLCNFFVHRNITDIPNTRNLTKIFMEIVQKLKEVTEQSAYEIIRQELIACSADEELFKKKLRGPLYQENDMATRYILCKIEEQYQTREIYTDLWSRDSNRKFIWTIEHIFPEGENIPSEWVKMIADGDNALAQDYRTQYVHTLGNLTLTGYNQNLSNLSFEKKMSRKNKEGKEIGYLNGLMLNKDVCNKTEWTVEYIKERTERLVAQALVLFSM